MSIDIEEVNPGDIVQLEMGEQGEVVSVDDEDNSIDVEVELDDGGVSTITVDVDEPWLDIVSSGDR